mmetsp:Transcript_50925/g.94168  ORF Transcript_50925/g.94168 Transcript_50925/m.94168 type:complete len:289 (+) Transcript_50925:62-928(+)
MQRLGVVASHVRGRCHARVSQAVATQTACLATAARQEHYFQVNGRSLYVLTTGDLHKGVPVLCMPGAMGTAETDFAYQLDGLCHKHGVVSLDPRGLGKSRPPNRRYPADFYHIDAADAAQVMQALNCPSFNVIGWSDGAIAATILAAKHPEQVKKLVVFGIQPSLTKEDVEIYEGMRDVEKAWSKRMLETHRGVYGDDVQDMWSSFCDAMQMIYKQGGDLCMKETKEIKCPTLVLHGEKDPVVPAHHADRYHKSIPGSQLYTFLGGKHNIHQKFAEEFNARVLKFFEE